MPLSIENPAQVLLDERLEALTHLMYAHQSEVKREVMNGLTSALQARLSPLARCVQEFIELPVVDDTELEGMIRGMRTRHKVALAESILRLIGEAQLVVMHRVEEVSF
jgi:hypothetical protein